MKPKENKPTDAFQQRYLETLRRNPDPRLKLLDQAMREAGIDLAPDRDRLEQKSTPPVPPT